MKTQLRGLTLTALLVSASQVTLADDAVEPSAVGDLPGYGEEAYFAEEATYAPKAGNATLGTKIDTTSVAPIHSAPISPFAVDSPAGSAGATDSVGDLASVGDLQFVGDWAPSVGDLPPAAMAHPSFGNDADNYLPIGVHDLRQVDHHVTHPVAASCDQFDCDGGCDSGCDSCGRASRFGRIGKLLQMDSDTWATAEFLMWFTQDRDMPALVSTSDPGTLPILPDEGAPNPNNVLVAFGDDINGELSGGFRGDLGRFVTDRVGFGGRFWILAENNDSYYAASDGTDMSIGRPFFNTNINAEDAVLVARDPNFVGQVAAESSLDLWAAEAYARLRLGCARDCQLDFIGGYSHFEIDDTLRISSTSTQTSPATGQMTTLSDQFTADNQFDGGQLGFEMAMRRGRWKVSSLTKVHLGNMQQRVRILGSNTVETPPAAPVVGAGGMLAQGNQGDFEQDTFAFAPEANFKLAYQLRNNMLFSVGYSFIYFDNVALVGDVLDRSIDGTSIPSGPAGTRPAFGFDDSSLWVQGLDLGFSIDY